MCSRIIVSRIWQPLKRPKLAQMCHMPKLAELSHEFLPHLAEIRLANTYQYWSLNIPGGVAAIICGYLWLSSLLASYHIKSTLRWVRDMHITFQNHIAS